MKSNKQGGFTLIELLVVIAIIAILAAMLGSCTMTRTISDGSRVGVVTKFSHKGTVNKSYEGELMLGSGNSAQTWSFSVTDSAVVKQVQDALDTQKTVSLHYSQSPTHNPWSQNTDYTVDKVTVIPK